MRIIFSFFCALFFTVSTAQQTDNGYLYTVDLAKVVKDRVYVELDPPQIQEQEITFYFPKIVPGTYAIADYGRYVTQFAALDKKGKPLPVEKVDTNTWKIKKAKNLAKITYWVDDSFDTTMEGPEIFWPAGTNIEDDKNFIINTSGFFGYFEGKKEAPFRFRVVREKELYGSTGLIPLEVGATPKKVSLEKTVSQKNVVVDVFEAEDYDQLIDSPLMYAKPDTAVIKVANTEVLIGSYSPNNMITAKEIAASIREVLMAQKEFLGGNLPVDKYAFIFHFTDKPIMSYGALEHSYSSLYFMPEASINEMNQQLRDFAAHEFFHIVTPLTVHSEQIENFDFNDPKMSQHLWLYEGVTEYFAGNVQVKYGLIEVEEYIQTLQEKMYQADGFNDSIAFTDLSKFTLDKYHDQYQNVYLKGALIAMCLDLRLLQLSEGKYGLQNLMLELSNRFGKNRAFEDEALFNIITEMTYPEIGTFFEKYVKGNEPLPLQEAFQSVGIIYQEEERFKDYTLGIGNEDLGIEQIDGKPRLKIATTENLNQMGKELGFAEGDILFAINGDTLPELGPNFAGFIQQQMMSVPSRDSISYTVLRASKDGKREPVELKAPVMQVEQSRRHMMMPNPEATEAQMKVRQAWLTPRELAEEEEK